MSDVVTVMAGHAEYVGRLKSREGNIVELENPRLITFNEQGGMGFAHGIAASGVEQPSSMTIVSPVFITETNEEVVKAWHQATSGLIV